MNPRSLVFSVVTAAALLACGAAGAQPSSAELRAQQAQMALSARYAQLYASLPAEQRRQFATAERRWLNVGRWDEQRSCLRPLTAQGGRDDGVADATVAADAAALCLAEVIEARLQRLAPAQVAAIR